MRRRRQRVSSSSLGTAHEVAIDCLFVNPKIYSVLDYAFLWTSSWGCYSRNHSTQFIFLDTKEVPVFPHWGLRCWSLAGLCCNRFVDLTKTRRHYRIIGQTADITDSVIIWEYCLSALVAAHIFFRLSILF